MENDVIFTFGGSISADLMGAGPSVSSGAFFHYDRLPNVSVVLPSLLYPSTFGLYGSAGDGEAQSATVNAHVTAGILFGMPEDIFSSSSTSASAAALSLGRRLRGIVAGMLCSVLFVFSNAPTVTADSEASIANPDSLNREEIPELLRDRVPASVNDLFLQIDTEFLPFRYRGNVYVIVAQKSPCAPVGCLAMLVRYDSDEDSDFIIFEAESLRDIEIEEHSSSERGAVCVQSSAAEVCLKGN